MGSTFGPGFKHLIFEDNYPPSQGDCYSLKKAFMNSGFTFATDGSLKQGILTTIRRAQGKIPTDIPPNDVDAHCLAANLEIYCELPPVFKAERTRWGDAWSEENYPTVEPLLRSQTKEHQKLFLDEAIYYTWICYAKLR